MIPQLIWRNLSRNKRRSMITIASVTFAIVIAILLRSLQKGVFNHLIDNIVSFQTGYLQIHGLGYQAEPILENSFELDSNAIKKWSEIEGIEQAAPRLESFALATVHESTKGCLVNGIDINKERQFTHIDTKITKGRYYVGNEKAILISEGLAERIKATVGDTLIILGQGFEGSMAAGKYPIIGILRFPMSSLNNNMIYLPLKYTQELFDAPNRLTALALRISEPRNLSAIAHGLKANISKQLEVVTWEEMMPDIVDHFKTDTIFFYIQISILYIIIAFGIFGTLLMMTYERRQENGMLLAVGMKKHQLGMILYGETVLLGMIGAIAGLLISWPIVYYLQTHPIQFTGEFARIYTQFGFEPIFPATLDFSIFLIQTLIILSLTIVLGIYPFLSILRMNPLTAMKNR